MPGNGRLPQTELGHYRRLHFHRMLLDRRQRATRPTQFSDQHARLQLQKPFAVADDRSEDCRHLVAEGYRYRLLQIAATNDWRVSVAARQSGERLTDGLQLIVDDPQTFTDLHDCRRVRDVLRPRAPVAIFAEVIPAQRIQLRDNAQNRIADALGLSAQLVHVDLADVAMAHDLVGRLLGNDAKTALHN